MQLLSKPNTEPKQRNKKTRLTTETGIAVEILPGSRGIQITGWGTGRILLILIVIMVMTSGSYLIVTH